MKFRDNEIARIISFKLPAEYREEGLHYYEIRRNYFSEPESIELRVAHDFFATVAFKKPLNLDIHDSIELTDDEREDIVYAMQAGLHNIEIAAV